MKLINILTFIISFLFSCFAGSDDINPDLFEGYGQATIGEVEELNKALQAQEGVTDIANLTGGGALQPQSLETTLALLTFQEDRLKLWKDLGTHKAFSTLEEYSIQDGYGTEGGFVGQIENPEEGQPDFRRAYAVIKYVRTLWKTADVLGLARTITDAETQNVQGSMMRALRVTEKTLFTGDSTIIPSSFDGLKYTIENNGSTDHVIDLRGAAPTESLFKQAAELINNNYGSPKAMYLSPGAQTVVDNMLFDAGSQRYNQEVVSSGSGLMALGHAVTEMRTSFGNFGFKPDIFIAKENQTVPFIKDPSAPASLIEGATSTKAPATPSHSVAINAPTVAGSLWAATGSGGAISGDYRYRIVAINQYGKSAADAAGAATTVATAGSLTVTVVAGAGAYPATGYEIYRETTPASAVYRLMKVVTSVAALAGVVDLNADLPGTAESFLIDNTSTGPNRAIGLSQLAPMHKVSYAKIGPYKWGTVNYYVVPKYYAPLRFVLFKNWGVGTTTSSPVIDL